MKLATLVLVGLFGMAGTAAADDDAVLNPPSGPVVVEQVRQPVGPGPVAPQGQLRKQRGGQLPPGVVKRFDRDGDGHLNPQERRHAIKALRRVVRRLAQEERADRRRVRMENRVIRRYDANGDGVVGPGEMPPRMQRRMQRLDRNGDGWVDNADR